jgi:hypothetical protein
MAEIAPKRVLTLPCTTTPKEETWTQISYPNFRCSECPTSWRYVSTWGKLMSNDGRRIVEALPGKGYYQTSLPVHIEGTYAGLVTVPLHRIVAFTFLGPPPSNLHTVDHINRIREDNRVTNLTWATVHSQLANRESARYRIRDVNQNRVYDSIASLAKGIGISVGVLSSLLRQAEPGDSFDMDGSTTIVLEHVSRKPMARPTVSVKTGTTIASSSSPTRKQTALTMYIEGATIEQISHVMSIKRNTVLHYIGQAARASPKSVLYKLAVRLDLNCPTKRDAVERHLTDFHKRVCGIDIDRDEYDRQYRDIVTTHFPQLQEDWKVVKETFRVILFCFEQ